MVFKQNYLERCADYEREQLQTKVVTELLAALDHIRELLDGASNDPESFISEAYRTTVEALERHKRESV